MDSTTIIREAGIKNTPIRLDVLNLFLSSKKALSSQDIELSLNDIDRSTLFRTLRTFEEKGIIHKAKDGTTVAKYALCSHSCDEHSHHDQHIHFRCTSCNSTYCIDELTIPEITLPKGFVLEDLEIVIKGSCIECAS